VSDTAISKPTSYRLSLGRGDRGIVDHGKGVVPVYPGIVLQPDALRFIVFRSCKLRGDSEIAERNVYGTSAAWVHERSSHLPPWDESWKIGVVASDFSVLNLYVSPVTFQQLWEITDASENEQFDVTLGVKPDPKNHINLDVFEFRLEKLRPRPHPVVFDPHPVVSELERLGQTIARRAQELRWLVAALLAIELIRWLWR
jgi:hypothetical protein